MVCRQKVKVNMQGDDRYDSYKTLTTYAQLDPQEKSNSGSPLLVFRLKLLSLVALHMALIWMYALEQMACVEELAETDDLWQGVNYLIMSINMLQCCTCFYIFARIDDQVDHLYGPSLPAREYKPSTASHRLYTIVNWVLICVLIFKTRGETIIEHLVFVLL